MEPNIVVGLPPSLPKKSSPQAIDEQSKTSQSHSIQGQRITQLETKFKEATKQLDDEKMRVKLYKRKVQDLEKTLAASKNSPKMKQSQNPVPKQTEEDYARLVKRCMAAIDQYEQEIVEMRKHIRKLQKENKQLKNLPKQEHKEGARTSVGSMLSSSAVHKEGHQHEHGSAKQIELSHEVERLKKAISVTQNKAEENEDRLKKQIKILQSKLHQFRETIKSRQALAAEPYKKQVEKHERQIKNLKLELEKSEQLIKELTQQKFHEHQRLPGQGKTVLNLGKNITKLFADAQKKVPLGKTMAATAIKNILHELRVNIEIILQKPDK